MEVKKTKFVKWKCKIHGYIDFYIDGLKPYKCVICAKQKSKEWKSNNREKTRKYQIEYVAKNPEKIKYHSERAKEISRQKTIERNENFNKNFGTYIEEIVSKISLKKIPTKLIKIENPTKEKIFKILINAKRNELKSYEIYRASVMVKWRHLKSHNMRSATEQQKSIIRDEYKKIAQVVVNAEMERILKNIK